MFFSKFHIFKESGVRHFKAKFFDSLDPKNHLTLDADSTPLDHYGQTDIYLYTTNVKYYQQIEMRDMTVDFIRQVCENLKLSVLTTHLSVQLLDRFMDGHNIDPKQLKLTALAVIFLAGKNNIAYLCCYQS